jgi:hypothetical protein
MIVPQKASSNEPRHVDRQERHHLRFDSTESWKRSPSRMIFTKEFQLVHPIKWYRRGFRQTENIDQHTQ